MEKTSTPSRSLHKLQCHINTADVRLESFQGEERVVVPVVAMVGDSVVHPLGSDPDEPGFFVPTEVLAEFPAQWNNTIVVPVHPTDDNGDPITACSPEVVTSLGYGSVFNAEIKNDKLAFEVWLSPSRAKIVGNGAEEAIAKAQSNQVVENSLSAFLAINETSGTAPDGTPYSASWEGMISDHFAFGLNGLKGACSVADGCGGPRAAMATHRVLRAAAKTDENAAFKMLRRAYHAFADLGIGDKELRRNLASGLQPIVPGFDRVSDVFQETGIVIYETFIQEPFSFLTWQRSFTVSDDGTIALGDDEQQVVEQIRVEFVPVDSSSTSPDGLSDIADSKSSQNTQPVLTDQHEGESMDKEKKAELVRELIDNESTPYTDKNKEWLMSADDAVLESLQCSCVEPESVEPGPVADITSSDVFVVPEGMAMLTTEEHATLIASVATVKEQQEARKSSLIEVLLAAKSRFSKERLEKFSLEDLATLAEGTTSTQLPDFSGMGIPVTTLSSEDKAPSAQSLSTQMKAATN